MEAHGFGAILAQRGDPSPQLGELLQSMKARSVRPLASYPHEWHFLPQKLVPIEATAPASAPGGMVAIPGTRDFVFAVSGVEIEGGDSIGVDVQYPWEDSPRRHHLHRMEIAPFWLDKYPVTNRQFKAFLTATGYRPEDAGNFLRNWTTGNYPAGQDNKPVTWVSIEDARAYAKWAGKRLPHEWEWQYAAQGTGGRVYPWGDVPDPARVPAAQHGRELAPPDDVDAHPSGASPFGVLDMTGNIWQWTDEFEDEHTRTAILRGGGSYRPSGSMWYFPQTFRLDEHGKYLLMAPSKDRSGMLGFRCAKDR
jgi:formylglycine-generating enzyme required for sulfatase activity